MKVGAYTLNPAWESEWLLSWCTGEMSEQVAPIMMHTFKAGAMASDYQTHVVFVDLDTGEVLPPSTEDFAQLPSEARDLLMPRLLKMRGMLV